MIRKKWGCRWSWVNWNCIRFHVVRSLKSKLAGDFSGFVPRQPPADAVWTLVGILDDEVRKMIALRHKAEAMIAEAESKADVKPFEMSGTVSVVNPGEPGHVQKA